MSATSDGNESKPCAEGYDSNSNILPDIVQETQAGVNVVVSEALSGSNEVRGNGTSAEQVEVHDSVRSERSVDGVERDESCLMKETIHKHSDSDSLESPTSSQTDDPFQSRGRDSSEILEIDVNQGGNEHLESKSRRMRMTSSTSVDSHQYQSHHAAHFVNAESMSYQGAASDNTWKLSRNSKSFEDSTENGQPENDYWELKLLSAALVNDIKMVEECLENGVKVDCHKGKKNALCVAAHWGHKETVNALVGANCDFNLPDLSDSMWERKAIHHAAAKGHLDIVKILTSHGASINSMDKDQRTPLHWASTNGWEGVARFLVEKGASVNIVQRDGFTPLHAATCLGHLSTCQYLLSQGAEINRADREGWSPLHAAICYGHENVVRLYLDSGARVNQKTRDKETPLHIGVYPANVGILSMLVDAGGRLEERNMQGLTPFFESVWRNKYHIARFFIDMGCKMNLLNNAGQSVLYIATVRAQENYLHLLIAAGYNLQTETWIRQGQFPVALSEHLTLCKWLKECISNPVSLQMLAVQAIRRELGCNITVKINRLVLPRKLKDLAGLKFLDQVETSPNPWFQ